MLQKYMNAQQRQMTPVASKVELSYGGLRSVSGLIQTKTNELSFDTFKLGVLANLCVAWMQ